MTTLVWRDNHYFPYFFDVYNGNPVKRIAFDGNVINAVRVCVRVRERALLNPILGRNSSGKAHEWFHCYGC